MSLRLTPCIHHTILSLIHQYLILLFICPAFSPICHIRFYTPWFYNSLIYVGLELDGYFLVTYYSGYFITVLYMSGLSLTGTFLSHITPVTSLRLFKASRTVLQSVVDTPSASNIDPRYLKVVTFLSISSPPSLTLLS